MPHPSEEQSNQGPEVGAYLILLRATRSEQWIGIRRIAGRRYYASPNALVGATHFSRF